jgi:hypothetical protein
MRNESRHYGPALHDWLENECRAQGYDTLHDWATSKGISPRNVTGWKNGSTPTPDKLREVAAAITKPMVDVLLAAKILVPSDMGGKEVSVTPIMTPRQAIKASSLSSSDKRFLYKVLDSMESGDGAAKVESN